MSRVRHAWNLSLDHLNKFKEMSAGGDGLRQDALTLYRMKNRYYVYDYIDGDRVLIPYLDGDITRHRIRRHNAIRVLSSVIFIVYNTLVIRMIIKNRKR